MRGLSAMPLECLMSEQPPGVAWSDVKVHAEAVVIRNGVPIDDDGNPLPNPAPTED